MKQLCTEKEWNIGTTNKIGEISMLRIDWDKAEKLTSTEKQELLFYLFKIFTTETIISEYSLEEIPINLHNIFIKYDEESTG